MGNASGVTSLGTLTPDNLQAGEFPVVTRKRTIASGAGVLIRGTVLGRITASGKFVKSLSAAVDGSQTPREILLQDVDATAADKEAITALTGEFNVAALTIGAGHTAASIRDGLQDLSIFI